MTRSAAEVLALATRAARGGGAPAGQAALFGRAAVAHLARGGAASALQDALATLPGGPILSLPLVLDDLAGQDGAERHAALTPDAAALAPAYASLLRGNVLSCDTRDDASIKVTLDPGTSASADAPARIHVTDSLLDMMRALAARTLVPATEASRLAGAGAGLTDND